MRSTLASHLRLTMASWEPPLKMILIQLQEKLPRNSKSNILWSFGIWSKLERSQSSKVGVSWADQKSKQTKNKSSFWSVVFSYSMQQQWTISLSDCDMWQKVDFIPQQTITSSVVGLRRSFKALPKAKPAPKEDQSYCLVVCWPSDHKFCESRQNHYIWEVCSANRLDVPKLQCLQSALVNKKGPILHSNAWLHSRITNASKVEQIGLRSFASPTKFTWPLTNGLPLLQTFQKLFAGTVLPQPAGGRKYLKGLVESRSTDSYAIGIKKHFSLAKLCWP